MSDTNGAAGLRAGRNTTAEPPRVIALGYYDGPTDGLICWPDGSVYRFAADDQLPPDEPAFTFARMPADAFDRLAAILAEHFPPRWPVWAPVWRFPTADVQRQVEAAVDAVIAEAGPAEWHVRRADVGFTDLTAEPVAALARL